MTTLCPVCNNTLDRKYHKDVGEEVLRCRVCQKYSLEGIEGWLNIFDAAHFRALIKIRDNDAKRWKRFMESPITDPIWTDISP